MRPDGPNAPPPGSIPPWMPQDQPRWPLVLMTLATVAVGMWTVTATAGLQFGVWFATEYVDATGAVVRGWTWPLVALVNAVLVAVPAGLLWLLAIRFTPRLTGVVTAVRAWTVAGLAGGLLGLVRAVAEPHNEIALLATAALAVLAAIVVRRIVRIDQPGEPAPLVGFAVAAGVLVLLPWLWVGALGGLTETVTAAAAAAGFGWLAGGVVGPALFAGYARSRVRLVLLGGLVAGVALAALSAGLGGRGVSMSELFLLPTLGFAAAALAVAAGTTVADSTATGSAGPDRGVPRLGPAPIAVMVAIAAFGPLAFVDPEETSLLLGTADVAWWAIIGTALSIGIGLVVSAGYGLALSPRRPPRWIPATLALLVVAAGIGVYGLAGRPGFYGERLFVVLSGQADLSGLDTIADRPARLRQTYQRLVEFGERTQAPLRESLDRWGLHYTPYYLVNAILVDGGPLVRQWLSGRSDVDRVLVDQRLRPLPVGVATDAGSEPAPDNSPQWNITMVGAPRVWSEFGDEGQGIVIGTSDSGVDGRHPDLRDGFRGGDDSWYDPWNATRAPTDHGGHGTHTMGTVLGRNGIGVAPRAQWIGCVNLDRNLGSPSRYLDCLQFMLAPFPAGANPWHDGRPDRAPDILTNSWGCPRVEGCDADALRPATAALKAAGIYFVAAAGNTGPHCATVTDPPATYPDVLTVGAVSKDRVVTDFSSRGPTQDGRIKPDVVAPGAAILSALPDDTYGVLDGTSMATPHVAGVVALMWSANPALIGHIDATTRILRDTATPVRAGGAANACGSAEDITGTGLVDAYAAVRAAKRLG